MEIPSAWQTKYADAQLDLMRHTCDPIADAVAAQIERKRPSQMIDEVYALTAYLLYRNGVIGVRTTLGPQELPDLEMPARDRFFVDSTTW